MCSTYTCVHVFVCTQYSVHIIKFYVHNIYMQIFVWYFQFLANISNVISLPLYINVFFGIFRFYWLLYLSFIYKYIYIHRKPSPICGEWCIYPISNIKMDFYRIALYDAQHIFDVGTTHMIIWAFRAVLCLYV